MTPERDEQREQLIDDVVDRLIVGERVHYIDEFSGNRYSVTMSDLLIKEVEEHGDGFADFMAEVHLMCNVNLTNPEYGYTDVNARLRTQRRMIVDQMTRIARPWVEDYIEDIERAVIDEAAYEDARRRFDDRQDYLNGGF